MTSSPSPTPGRRPYQPRHAAPDPHPSTPLHALDGATTEIRHWQQTIGDIGDQRQAHPVINQMRFESATRAMASLDQLDALVTEVLTALGAPPWRIAPAPRGPAHRPRRWPPELAGVTESELQGEHLRRLTYAQLHAFAMADHPDEVEAMARQWYAISQAAWHRGTRVLGAMRDAPDFLCPQLARLGDDYWGFAARTDHYATTFTNAAASHREARTRLEELGPP